MVGLSGGGSFGGSKGDGGFCWSFGVCGVLNGDGGGRR